MIIIREAGLHMSKKNTKYMSNVENLSEEIIIGYSKIEKVKPRLHYDSDSVTVLSSTILIV